MTKYTKNFTAATSVVIPASEHGITNKHIVMNVYLSGTPNVVILANSFEVNEITFEVTITFGEATTGFVVLVG